MASTLDTSIIDSLVPTIDTIRAVVHGAVGDHQYEVDVVRRRWPSGRRGDTTAGDAVDSIYTISPSPRVQFAKGLDFVMEAAGRHEEGACRVSEVSLAISEDQLSPGTQGPGDEFFYRLRDAKGQKIADRFYNVAGPIVADREDSIGWVIMLSRRQVRP